MEPEVFERQISHDILKYFDYIEMSAVQSSTSFLSATERRLLGELLLPRRSGG